MNTTTAKHVDATPTSRDPARWRRRAWTFPAIYLGALAACAFFPLALPLAFLGDLVRWRRFALTRCVVFFLGYLVGEVFFMTLGGVQWLLAPGWTRAGRERLLRWTHWLGRGWGLYLDRGGRACFSVRLDVTGREALAGGPVICFLRHVSVADNLFAPGILGHEGSFQLRYVAKSELQLDPIFDLIGNRLVSCFVKRSSGQTDREVAAVTALLDGLAPNDAIVVWPEGTRFSEEKRKRVLEAIEKRGDPVLTARAKGLKHVLPPRLGGPVALLESAVERGAGTDVLFCLHAGYEGAATFADLVQGRAIGRTVRVHLERVPFAELPRGREALTEWFYARWERLDRWVDQELPRVVGA